MTFLNILFLAGMAGVAGPILAHLLARPRYKRIPFTMMQFLEAGQMESQRRRRIRNLLVLLLRCAIITCIVLGFAGPLTEKNIAAKEGTTPLTIGIDDSLSMAYEDRFDDIRSQVKAAVAQRPSGVQIDILGLASGERIQQASPADAVAFLDALAPVPATAQVNGLLGMLNDGAGGGSNTQVILASDFTPQFLLQTVNVPHPAIVARCEVITPDLDTAVENLRILDVKTTATGPARLQFSVTVRNQGKTDGSVIVDTTLNDAVLASEPLQISMGHSQSVLLEVTVPELQRQSTPLTLSIRLQDGLEADNHYYIGVQYPENAQEHIVIVCNDAREAFLTKTALEALGDQMPHMQFVVQTMPYSDLNELSFLSADTLIITAVAAPLQGSADALKRYLEGGGRLLTFTHRDQDDATLAALYAQGILPALPGKLQQQSATLATAVSNTEAVGNREALHALENYQMQRYVFDAWYACEAAENSLTQWPLESGDALLYRMESDAGESILLNTSADDSLSGFMKSPTALPLLGYLVGEEDPLETSAFHADDSLTWPRLDQGVVSAVPIISPSGQRSVAQPERGLLKSPPLGEIGLARADTDPPLYLGLNIPKGETDLAMATPRIVDDAVARLFETTETTHDGGSVTDATEQTHYGSWALTAALLFLLLETRITNRMVR